MSHGTGRGGCYDIALEYKDQSPGNKGEARLYQDSSGVSTIKLNGQQGLHVSSTGVENSYWNLKPYFEDLRDYMDPDLVLNPQAYSVNLTYPTSTYDPGPIILNILEVVVGGSSVKLVVETMNGNSPNFGNLSSDNMPTGICLPHPSGESSDHPVADEESDGSESDEDRAGDGPVDDGGTLEYTTGIKVLEDVMPEPPLVYDGNDLIITLDLRNIIYKPSALDEIIDPAFKSY